MEFVSNSFNKLAIENEFEMILVHYGTPEPLKGHLLTGNRSHLISNKMVSFL